MTLDFERRGEKLEFEREGGKREMRVCIGRFWLL